MAKKPKDTSAGIGRTLDCIEWDYQAPKKERRFFLNPIKLFFGDFPWEGRGDLFPIPSPPTTPQGSEGDSDSG